MSEKTFTLDEARKELAKRECSAHGHDWDIVMQGLGTPVAIICSRCGRTHQVVA